MFAVDGGTLPACVTEPPADEAAARAQCVSCRIQLACLHRALEYERLAGEQLDGVRGGLSASERAQTTLTRVS